ncbi:hypothetical protein PG991_014666 [Apiospora marii]|uniref:Zn(2)-C6 fungal-type domain-containing protein n=1 Tax=Apiospora marii TaxID=335849 RepID=A0ABR1R4X5_9PEZI
MASTTRPSDPVLRRACDRCHTHKLSCQREASGQCTRCLKANATCTTSPSMRNRRHRRSTRAADRLPPPLAAELPQSAVVVTRPSIPVASTDTSTELVPDPHTDLDQGAPDFNDITHQNPFAEDANALSFIEELMTGSFQEQAFLQNLDTTWWSSPASSIFPTFDTTTSQLGALTDQTAPSTAPNTTRDEHSLLPRTADGEWLQKLVQVNVRLFAHANKGKDGDKDAPQGNSFDQTIKTSLQFIQALRHLQGSSSRDLPSRSRTASPQLVVDPGTMLIVYSCYVRIVELLIDRLHAVQEALKTGTAGAAANPTSTSQDGKTAQPPSSGFPALEFPTISVCTCTLEDYPVLRMRLTLELVEEKLDVMGALLHSMHSNDSRQKHGPMAATWRGMQQSLPTTGIPQQALLARGEIAYQIIRDIRNELKKKRQLAS